MNTAENVAAPQWHYPAWDENVQMVLGFLDLDFALGEDKHVAPAGGTKDYDVKLEYNDNPGQHDH
jgi:hypothetical protein